MVSSHPEHDYAALCSNCHSVIHRMKVVHDIEAPESATAMRAARFRKLRTRCVNRITRLGVQLLLTITAGNAFRFVTSVSLPGQSKVRCKRPLNPILKLEIVDRTDLNVILG